MEWTAAVRLPEKGERKYHLDLTIEVPSAVFAVHNVWDCLQAYTRLQSPSEQGDVKVERADVDELRRDTLGVAHRLKQLLQRYERVCQASRGMPTETVSHTAAGHLLRTLDDVDLMIVQTRQHLYAPTSHPVADAVKREWVLADEFLSHKLIDFISSAERHAGDLIVLRAAQSKDPDAFLNAVLERLERMLATELHYRDGNEFVNPRTDAPAELAIFVERSSMLKKHFQDVLYLESESYMVDARLRNWTAIAAAGLAATFWVGFTLFFPISRAPRFGLSFAVATTIFTAAYAFKDRIKDVGRSWLTGQLERLWGQRLSKLRIPGRFDPQRAVLVETSERIETTRAQKDDPLNSNIGQTRRVVRLHYAMGSDLIDSAVLRKEGIDSVKHIIRYDLSPFFGRLDDGTKRVPVLDKDTGEVHFTDAPKEYRFHVTFRTLTGDAKRGDLVEQLLTHVVVVTKQGISRVEMA